MPPGAPQRALACPTAEGVDTVVLPEVLNPNDERGGRSTRAATLQLGLQIKPEIDMTARQHVDLQVAMHRGKQLSILALCLQKASGDWQDRHMAGPTKTLPGARSFETEDSSPG